MLWYFKKLKNENALELLDTLKYRLLELIKNLRLAYILYYTNSKMVGWEQDLFLEFFEEKGCFVMGSIS